MNWGAKAGSIFDRVLDCLMWIGAGLLVFVMTSVCLDVVMRYFFHRPLIWVIEVVGYMILAITFLGAAYVLREEGHTRVDLVLSRLNPTLQTLVDATTSILGTVICSVLTWYSAQVAWQHYKMGYYLDTALDPPSFYFHGVVSAGCLLLFIQFLRRSFGFLRKWITFRRNGQVS